MFLAKTIKIFMYCWSVSWLQLAEVNVQFRFHVQLQKYMNEFNLKYIPERTSTPYCCCNDRSICFNSTSASNLSYASCNINCQLRFTLCAWLTSSDVLKEAGPNTSASYCFESDVHDAYALFTFGCLSPSKSFFLEEEKFPYFLFPLQIYSENVSVCCNICVCNGA